MKDQVEIVIEEESKILITDFNDSLFDRELYYFLTVLQEDEEIENRLCTKECQCVNTFFDTIILLEEISYANIL